MRPPPDNHVDRAERKVNEFLPARIFSVTVSKIDPVVVGAPDDQGF